MRNYFALVRKLFLGLFLLFPFGLILRQIYLEFFNIFVTGKTSDFIGWLPQGINSRFTLIFTFTLVFIFVVIIIFVCGNKKMFKKLDALPDYIYILIILIIGFSFRDFLIGFINTQPVSDFALIHEDAKLLALGKSPRNMYVASHVMVTMIYGTLYSFFGVSLKVIKNFHTLCYMLSGIFIYFSGKEYFNNKFWAFLAGILVALWPSISLYSNVFTSEHLFILVECILLFVLSHFFKNVIINDVFYRSYLSLEFIFIGFLLGVMGLFRPFNALFLGTFFLTIFLYNFSLRNFFLNCSIFFLIFLLLGKVPEVVARHYSIDFVNLRICNLLSGVNINTFGQYNLEDKTICRKLISEVPDDFELSKKVAKIFFERLYEGQKHLLGFVDKKFAILWANSNGMMFWVVQPYSLADDENIINFVKKISLFDFYLMFIATIMCSIGLLISIRDDIEPIFFFCLFSFFSFNLMEIFFEVQTRYRVVVLPLFIFFACWGFSQINLAIYKLVYRNKDV